MRWVDMVCIVMVGLVLWIVNELLFPFTRFSKTATRLIKINKNIVFKLCDAYEAKYYK